MHQLGSDIFTLLAWPGHPLYCADAAQPALLACFALPDAKPRCDAYATRALPKSRPNTYCSWVIPGRLMIGAYPGAVQDDVNDSILVSLLELGLGTYVCLQAEYDHHADEDSWRRGDSLRPYIFDAVRLLPTIRWPKGGVITTKPSQLQFVHLPIVDCATAADDRVLRLSYDLCDRMIAGETIYLHCWGGELES